MRRLEMGARTRSAQCSPVESFMVASDPHNTTHEPLNVFIAHEHISAASRFITLKHPHDGSPKRFLFCPTTGLYEMTSVSVPSSDPRSLMFTKPEPEYTAKDNGGTVNKTNSPCGSEVSDGCIKKEATIVTVTPFDIAFLLLRHIAPSESLSKKSMFQPLDDLLDVPGTEDRHFKYMLDNGQDMVSDAMSKICDTVEAGDEKMYRYSGDKVLDLILRKSTNVIAQGLPATLEEKFVTRVLDVPVLSMKREQIVVTTGLTPDIAEQADTPTESSDSQSTAVSTTVSTIFSEVTTSTTVTDIEQTIPSELYRLQRLRTAFNFITASYLPTHVAMQLQQRLSSKQSPVNFQPLDEHLLHLASLRAEALASRSLSDFSRKRGQGDDYEANEARLEKKRRLEEEEKKRKASESRGVRDLKKVNVTGMKKMSDFFSKKPVLAKSKS